MTLRRRDADALAQGLGWFSVALGIAEFLAPGRLGRAAGTREVINGVGLITAADPVPWMWGRVGGDALDLLAVASSVGRAAPRRSSPLGRTLLAWAAVTALDVVAARALQAAAPRRRRLFDYGDRSGLPRGLAATREAVRTGGLTSTGA